MNITLTVTSGPHEGKKFSFDQHDYFLVGRSPQAHFRLPFKDRFISRIHFMVEINPPMCRLVDMKSRNKTYVNGKPILLADLQDGDTIKAGKTFLLVSLHENETNPETQPEPGSEITPEIAAGVEPEPWANAGAEPPASMEEGEGEGEAEPAPEPPPPPEESYDSIEVASLQHSEESAPGNCVVCGSPIPTDQTLGDGTAICSSCLEEIGNQDQEIEGYQMVRELGRGGMGVIYLAVRNQNNSLVALKTIIPLKRGTKRDYDLFLREANILRELDHPNIVAFRDMGESSGKLYMAMDYIPGSDALSILKQSGPLPLGRALDWILQLLSALEYAHSKGFIHRDIKPGNIMISPRPDGEPGEVVRLTDFGLARVYQASQMSGLTMLGGVAGTLSYMAPEQITNFRNVTPATDQYSAAATLYHLLTKKVPFHEAKDKQERIIMILEHIPPRIETRLADIPSALGDVIHRALAKDPQLRFPNVAAFREALVPFGE